MATVLCIIDFKPENTTVAIYPNPSSFLATAFQPFCSGEMITSSCRRKTDSGEDGVLLRDFWFTFYKVDN